MAQTAFQDLSISTAPPSRRPLHGITIMLVEDSRTASEALRLMAVQSGARLRRADSLTSASRHLAIYRPNVVIVDLGLPDGNGLSLIETMAKSAVPCPGLIAISGNDVGDWRAKAIAAGAHMVLPKPISDMATFREAILSVLPAADED